MYRQLFGFEWLLREVSLNWIDSYMKLYTCSIKLNKLSISDDRGSLFNVIVLPKNSELPLVVYRDYCKHLSTARQFFLLEISGQCRSLLFNSNWTDPIYDNLKNLTGEALLSLLYEMSPKPSEIFSHVMFVGQFIDLEKDVDMIMTDMGMCVFIFFLFFTIIYIHVFYNRRQNLI